MSNIIYKKDFWDFYTTNKNSMDAIITRYAKNYLELMGLDELKQELLVRLHKSDFLSSFDPTKSEIGTYTIQRIIGYIGHITAAEALYGSRNLSEPEYDVDSEDDEGINLHGSAITVMDSVEEELTAAMSRVLETKCSETDALIFLYQLDGYTLTEIAAMCGCSAAGTRLRICVVKKTLSSYLRDFRD